MLELTAIYQEFERERKMNVKIRRVSAKLRNYGLFY
jgi:hypothetical protein